MSKSFDEIADEYARSIHQAVKLDRLSRSVADLLALTTKTASPVQPIIEEFSKAAKSIGVQLEGLVYTANRKPLTEDDKKEISEKTARKLGLKRPDELRWIFKEASIDNVLRVSQEIEQVFRDVRLSLDSNPEETDSSK